GHLGPKPIREGPLRTTDRDGERRHLGVSPGRVEPAGRRKEAVRLLPRDGNPTRRETVSADPWAEEWTGRAAGRTSIARRAPGRPRHFRGFLARAMAPRWAGRPPIGRGGSPGRRGSSRPARLRAGTSRGRVLRHRGRAGRCDDRA